MNAFEIRAILYTAAALLFLLLGVRLGMHHVQAQWNIDKLAQAQLIAEREASIIELAKQRDALQSQVGAAHEQIIQNGGMLVAGVTDGLRKLEAAVRTSTVPRPVANPGGVQGTVAGAVGPDGGTASLDRFNAAIAKLSADCVRVDADRTAIISLEPARPSPGQH